MGGDGGGVFRAPYPSREECGTRHGNDGILDMLASSNRTEAPDFNSIALGLEDCGMSSNSRTLAAIYSHGQEVRHFPIEIGPRFLELFSENLYSSPNKAFEELVANSWDADATAIYISLPDDLQDENACIWVLDNGTSMDLDGLETLWKITSDHKRALANPKRPQIGKFGIGKLATYILASEITYICKASDGVIRSVSVNYRDIEALQGVWRPDDVPLTVRELNISELEAILATIPTQTDLLGLIKEGIPHQPSPHFVDEFHHPEPPPIDLTGNWTLVLLTSLRQTGRSIQRGRIRLMLRSALPLTSDVSICLNGELLESKKVDIEPHTTWVLGKTLDIDGIELDDSEGAAEQDVATVQSFQSGLYTHIAIDGIQGTISGQISLYQSRISGGKSDDLGPSNGFFINILGRVVNLEQSDFGLENLSHGTWAQFRATIRADGLDSDLGVERDGLRDSTQVRIFKRFLMATFNKARQALKEAKIAEWPKAGDILDGSWKTIPMKPLAEIVSERLTSRRALPSSIYGGDFDSNSEMREEWNRVVETNPGDLISSVKSESFGEQLPFSRYLLPSRQILVNESHPYFVERSGTLEERQIIQEFALTDFLTELYLIGNDVDPVALDDGRAFRDEFLRLLAQLNRRTGGQIAQMLHDATDNRDGFEDIIGEALDYIGFNVTTIGGKGQPEGLARAPLTPNDDPIRGPYSLTYEAKSTKKVSGRVSNKEVGAGRLARHRKDYDAEYTLVVAPDFELGVLQKECEDSSVTPMRARDLGRLLLLSATAGTMDFVKVRGLFELYDPDKVHSWVENFVADVESTPHLSIGDLLWALDDIGIDGPDELATLVIADRLRRKFDSNFPSEVQVRSAIEGLSVLLPAIVRNSGRQVYLSAAPADIRNALVAQLQLLPDSIREKIDPSLFDIGGQTV